MGNKQASLSAEEENFIKVTKIILEVVPMHLRTLFIETWDQKYPNNKWQSDSASGNFVFNEIPNDAKKGRNRVYASNMKSGNESDWDTTTLVYAMLYSQLNLIPICRPDGQRSAPLLISEEIDKIRKIRNEFFAHAASMKCSSATFKDIEFEIKSAAKNIFGIKAKNDIDEIVQTHITKKMTKQLKDELQKEKKRNDQFEKVLKEIEENVQDLRREVREIKDNMQSASRPQLKPYRKKDIGEFFLCISAGNDLH